MQNKKAMPNQMELAVDPDAPCGNAPSFLSQDPDLSFITSNPPAAEEDTEAASSCPDVLWFIYNCPKGQRDIMQGKSNGWLCHWCGKLFKGVHALRALCHLSKNTTKQGVVPCA